MNIYNWYLFFIFNLLFNIEINVKLILYIVYKFIRFIFKFINLWLFAYYRFDFLRC